jgi:hypothetical protein
MATETTTVRKYKNYAEKQVAMTNGTYEGNSPFHKNIPEFQHLKPLSSYPHLQGMRPGERIEHKTIEWHNNS